MVILNSTPGVKRKYVDAQIAGLVDGATTYTTLKLVESKLGNETFTGDSVTAAIASLQSTINDSDSGLAKVKTIAEQGVSDAAAATTAAATAKTAADAAQSAADDAQDTADAAGTAAAAAQAGADAASESAAQAQSDATKALNQIGYGTAEKGTVDTRLTAIETSIGTGGNLETRVGTLEGKVDVDKVSTAISTAKSEAISAVQGDTTKTVEGLEDLIGTASDTAADSTVYGAIADAKAAGTAAQGAIDTLNTNLGDLKTAEAINSAISTAKNAVLGEEGYTQTVKSAYAAATAAQSTADKNETAITAINNETSGILAQAKGYTDDLLGGNFSTTSTVSAQMDAIFSGTKTGETITASGLAAEYAEQCARNQVATAYKVVAGSVESLPATANVGDVYNTSKSITVDSVAYPAGTNFVYTESGWDALAGITDLSDYATRAATNTALTAIGTDLTNLEADVTALYGAKASNPVTGTFKANAASSGSATITWSDTTYSADTNDCIIVEFDDPESAYSAGITITAITGNSATYTMDYTDSGAVNVKVVAIPKGSNTATHAHDTTIPGTDTTIPTA